MSGILREVNDSLGKHQKCMIVMGRISQGLEEMRGSTAQEREEVSREWIVIERDLKKSNKSYRHLHMSNSAHAVQNGEQGNNLENNLSRQ